MTSPQTPPRLLSPKEGRWEIGTGSNHGFSCVTFPTHDINCCKISVKISKYRAKDLTKLLTSGQEGPNLSTQGAGSPQETW